VIILSAARARFSNFWTTLAEAEAILKIRSVDCKILLFSEGRSKKNKKEPKNQQSHHMCQESRVGEIQMEK
jgi:hypothetical protein